MSDLFIDGTLRGGVSQHQKNELMEAVAEAAQRKMEALRLYEPTEFQRRFHECTAKECALIAGNQTGKACRADTPVLTPSGWARIDSLRVGDKVIGGDGSPCNVVGVYPQGVKRLYEVMFDDGSTTACCREHLWACRIGKKERFKSDRSWRVHSLEEILQAYTKVVDGVHYAERPVNRADIPLVEPVGGCHKPPIDPYTLGYLLGDGSLSQGVVQFTTADKCVADRIHHPGCEVKHLRRYVYSVKGEQHGKNPLLVKLRSLGLMGSLSHTKFIPDEYFQCSAEDRLSLLQGLMDSDGYCEQSGVMEFCSTSTELTEGVVRLVQSLGGKCKVKWRVTKCNGKPGRPSSRVRIVLPGLCPFRIKRKAERYRDISRNRSRIIHSIRPIGEDEAVCIRVDSDDHTFVINDYIVTHNSLSGFVELARALTGQDPYGKYPTEDGIAVVLGMDEGHIGRNIYSYLFESARFRLVRDNDTGEWRAWRPWLEPERENETIAAPPLLPERLVKEIVYRKRGSRIFEKVVMHNGWVLYAMSSKGEPTGGFQADLVLIDEDIDRPDWYDELVARTTMRDGRMLWAALPLNKNDAMADLCDRAEECEGEESPETVVIRATVFDNIYMPKRARDENIRIWKSQGEDVYRKRAMGEMVIDSILMYPTFSRDVHGAVSDSPRTKIHQYLSERMGTPGPDWCLYAVVDPGFAVCATTFWAVPPPEEFGHFKVCYDMAYQKGCTAAKWGEMMRHKCDGKSFHAFIIDEHGGRLRSIESGITPRRQYENELEKHGVSTELLGPKFLSGSDDIAGREGTLREWLTVRPDGTPTMLIVTQRCDKLVWEFGRFKRKIIQGVIQDEGNRRGHCHAVETCEYASAHGLEYVPPAKKAVQSTYVQRAIAGRKAREAQRKVSVFSPQSPNKGINLGPRGDEK